ncbi:3-dehydroquinate synthase [hydrothermal vent metagenome]|uniref:3-dehydroquinate synthase n=1 Tax=hydrothermal vent metagenome TaxID=652676 RepID=A0A3B1DR42_9ZZZZ
MTHSPPNPHSIRVELSDRAYQVRIGSHLLADLPRALAETFGSIPRAAFLIADANVNTHADPAIRALAQAGCRVSTTTITATEEHKSLETLARLLVEMGTARLERTDPVIAIGGGITGDLAGFAAATYRRGVPVIQCPTTLLSMVDASVGGKTGVNLKIEGSLQKNMAGAFHQPSLVLADIATLATLPDRHFRAGLAECIKHGLLDGCTGNACTGDATHLDWLTDNLDAILARHTESLLELIARSVTFKAAIVAGDEHELATTGPSRALLNLGHTFAHAIETLPSLSPTSNPTDAPLLHGEAVALGLVAAFATSAHLGMIPAETVERVRAILIRCALPTSVAGLPDAAHLLARMGADKKTASGRLRLILPTPGCAAELIADPPRAAIQAGWLAVNTQ